MYKGIRKISKTILGSLVPKKMPVRKFKMLKNILVISDADSEEALPSVFLSQALDRMREDYDITFVSFDKTLLSTNLDAYHLIIGHVQYDDTVYRFMQSLSNVSIPKGLILSNSTELSDFRFCNSYDIIWFDSFRIGSLIPNDINKYHGFGLNYNEGVNENLVKVLSPSYKILYARFHNLPWQNLISDELIEFINCPLWDIEYYGNQLRRGIESIVINNCRISNRITSNTNLKVGRHSFHNGGFEVRGDVFASVGSFCSFGKNVQLYTVNHDTRFPTTQGYLYRNFFNVVHPGVETVASKERSKGPIHIGNDVWIGDDVKIMSGVTIGDGVCIAAGSVVTKNVGSYEVIGGVPAKKIKDRFSSDVVDFLMILNWWNWSDEKIKKNQSFFSTNLSVENSVADIRIK